MKKIFDKQNIFLFLLVMMIIAGKFVPYRESYNEVFNLEKFINWGIAGIFLLYGLKLNLKEMWQALSHWKLHLVIQVASFLLFPLLVFLFYGFFKESLYFTIWLSVFFLASLPSTVSSSVVMVSMAKGNVTSAIFNASISGLIGILMTPLLMSFFFTSEKSEESGDLMQIFYELLKKVILPIVLGLLFNSFLKKWVIKYSKWIAEFDRLIILLIVYESFSAAFMNQIFSSVPISVFLILAASVILLFFVIYEIIKFVAKKLKFNREDTITATFCGSKKSLVHGSLFVIILGIPESQKVLFLLPVMIYHSFQLFYVSWLANRLSKTV